MTNSTAAENQAVTAFENAVDASYTVYWNLLGNGSVVNGVFTLDSQAVPLYTGQTAAALKVANPTTAQVQSYTASQYQHLINLFVQTFGPGWQTLPEFQTYDPSFLYVATAQQVANLQSNANWTSNELMYPIADVAVDPQNGTPVGITVPNISGVNVTIVAGGSVGQTAASITIPLADVQSGTLTTAQQQAIANATAPGDIKITSAGVVVSPTSPVYISATGALTATSGGSLTVQSTAPDITVNQVIAGGPVNITAPESILGTGSGTQITTPSSTVLKAGTGSLGTSTSPLGIKTGGALYPYAPAGNTHLTVNGLTAVPITLNAVEGQSLASAAGSPLVVANFFDSAAAGNVGEFTATINWGDGTPGTTGVISYNPTTQQFAV